MDFKDFNIDGLSPTHFEHLIQSLAKKIIGNGTVTFGGPGTDGGREATFEGKMDYPSSKGSWDGYLVLQCKHSCRKDDPQGWVIRELRKELDKFLDPTKDLKKPEYYLMVTNVQMTGVSKNGGKDKIEAVFKEYQAKHGLKGWGLWDYDEICPFLVIHDEIRTFYEPLIGLSDVFVEMHRLLIANQAGGLDPEPPGKINKGHDFHPRDKFFVGRDCETLLQELQHSELNLLFGDRGIGKTRYAMEFFNQYGTNTELYPAGAIWLTDGDHYKEHKGKSNLTEQLGEAYYKSIFTGKQRYDWSGLTAKAQQDFGKAAVQWIEQSRGCLVVIDDLIIPQNNQPKVLRELLSAVEVSRSTLLVTSFIPLEECQKIEVPALQDEEARELLQHHSKREFPLEELAPLFTVVEKHTLTLEVIGHFLKSPGRHSDTSVLEVVTRLQTSKLDDLSFMTRDDDTDGTDHIKNVYASLMLYEDQINDDLNLKTAARTLALFHSQQINPKMWRTVAGLDENKMEKAEEALINFGLCVYETKEKTYHLHSLMRRALETLWDEAPEMDEPLERLSAWLDQDPKPFLSAPNLAHLERGATLAETNKLPVTGELLSQIGHHLLTRGLQGDLAEAINQSRTALELDKSAFGENHPKVAKRLDRLGIALQTRGRQGELNTAIGYFK